MLRNGDLGLLPWHPTQCPGHGSTEASWVTHILCPFPVLLRGAKAGDGVSELLETGSNAGLEEVWLASSFD